MATLNINSWTLTPLNPDGTTNTNLPELTGSIPNTEICDFGCMGQKMKLILECEMADTYADSTTANVNGTLVRFTPALFAEAYSKYFAPGTFPSGGYILQIPNTSSAIYTMALSFPSNEFANSNENGTCLLEVTSSTEFTITYEFRMTMDLEGYLSGKSYDNRFRLTKNSQYATEELNSDRNSVYGYQRSLNAVLATKQRNYVLYASEFSLLFRASFNNNDSDLVPILPMTVSFTPSSDPSGTLTGPSAFEDTVVKLEFDDPDADITVDEISVILAKRNLELNVAGFGKDLDLKELKLVTTGSTSTISGPFKGPVAYTQSGGVTSVEFTIDHTQLVYNTAYDIHALVEYQKEVSSKGMLHAVLKSGTGTDSLPLNFNASSRFYSRNGNTANDFTATVMERIANVLTLDMASYNNEATLPYTNFLSDIQTVKFELLTIFGNVLYSGQILKNSSNNTFTDNENISVEIDGDNIHFIATEFRIPFDNNQNLPNLGQNASNVYTFKWYFTFQASADDLLNIEYRLPSTLTIRQYENSENEPSGAPKVSNIRFLDPATGFPIGAWCDMEKVLVMADIEDLGEDTFVQVFVDKFPYGALYKNDVALEESDPAEHASNLPSYVEFTQLESDRITNLDANPTDGVISFTLDISELQGIEINRVSVFAYRANP